jgi:osmoprotectant transport system substrate-binding protein
VQQIGNRELYEPALEKGDLDVVPEYAATLATFLQGKVDKNGKDPSSPELDTTMTNLKVLGDKVGLSSAARPRRRTRTRSPPRPRSPTSTASRPCSDLAPSAPARRPVLGGPAECPQRPEVPAGPGRRLQASRPASSPAWTRVDPLTKTALKQVARSASGSGLQLGRCLAPPRDRFSAKTQYLKSKRRVSTI